MKSISFHSSLRHLEMMPRRKTSRTIRPGDPIANWILGVAVPTIIGAAMAFAILQGLRWIPAGQQVSGLVALSAASAWLYAGHALSCAGAKQALLDLTTAVLVLFLAFNARSNPAIFLAAAFAVQSLWSAFALSHRGKEERLHRSLLFFWLAFHMVLAVRAWTLYGAI